MKYKISYVIFNKNMNLDYSLSERQNKKLRRMKWR